jgi:hypothetical protein
MALFTVIHDARLQPDAKILSVDALAFRDNPIAIIEGDATAIAAGHQIKTAALEDAAVTTVKMDGERWRVLIFSDDSAFGAAPPGMKEVTIDNSIDWRNRMLSVSGSVYRCATAAIAANNIIGGSAQANINYDRAVAIAAGRIDAKWMYTANGSAAYNAQPFCVDSDTRSYLWVNAAGVLNLSWMCVDVNTDFAAINLMILYTDQI